MKIKAKRIIRIFYNFEINRITESYYKTALFNYRYLGMFKTINLNINNDYSIYFQ